MIVIKLVRLLSLAIVALVVIVGVRGMAGGLGFGGDPLDTPPSGSDAAAVGKRSAADVMSCSPPGATHIPRPLDGGVVVAARERATPDEARRNPTG